MNFLRSLRVRRLPGDVTKGIMQCKNRVIPCALGRGGPSVFKREGDGATPAQHVLRPVNGFYRGDRVQRPHSRLAFDAIGADDGWCDAPENANYNIPVALPFAASHEMMMRDDRLYDIGVVLDWNMPIVGRVRHRGSAIFLHLCKPGYQATEGCIAVEEPDMRWLLARISNQTQIIVTR